MAEENNNLIYVGEAEPPHTICIGDLPTITLPSEAEQRKGFYAEHALVIWKSVDGYKLLIEFKPKGRRTTTVLDTSEVEEN